MNVLVVGSRAFAPLSMVDAALQTLPPDATVTAFGTSPLCRRAVLAATSLGLAARNAALSPSRRELVEAAQRPDTELWAFVANQPGGNVLTAGTAALLAFLMEQGLRPKQIASPLPGSVCALISKHHALVDKAVDTRNVHGQRVITTNALKANRDLVDARDKYLQKLEAGMWLQPDDEGATEKWLKWLACYECLSNELEEAKAVLGGKAVAA